MRIYIRIYENTHIHIYENIYTHIAVYTCAVVCQGGARRVMSP